MTEFIKVKKLTETAKLPTKAKDGDMGWDLYSDVEGLAEQGGFARFPDLEDETDLATYRKNRGFIKSTKQTIRTGIAIELPPGYGAIVVGRSGLTSSTALRVNLGVIDSGYRGEIHIMYDIVGDEFVSVKRGDKIAQMLILPIPDFELIEVEELSETQRGSSGFGSTGR